MRRKIRAAFHSQRGALTAPRSKLGNEPRYPDRTGHSSSPRELARAQGFPDSYQFVGTIAEQIAAIGNSQSPPVARALFAANLDESILDGDVL